VENRRVGRLSRRERGKRGGGRRAEREETRRQCEKAKRCGCSLVITFMHGEGEEEQVKGEKKRESERKGGREWQRRKK